MNLQRQLAGNFYYQRDREFNIPDCLCADKHMALKTAYDQFNKAGVEARYRVFGFNWDDLPLEKSVLAIPHRNEDEHVCLEVKLDGKWYLVDATWDKSLSIAKFPINKWNGLKANMINAVNPTYALTPKQSHESMMADINSPEDSGLEEDLDENDAFYTAINSSLAEARKEYAKYLFDNGKRRTIVLGK